MELTYKERLLFIFQLMILEKLYPENNDNYKNLRKALEEGYTAQYDWFFDYIIKPEEEMPLERCKIVWDILEMYDCLISSFSSLTDKQELTDYFVKFPGFDGNHETGMMSYSEYITKDLNRFGYVSELHQKDFNSHTEMLGRYRGMLSKFHAIPSGSSRALTLQQIRDIISIN